MTYVLSYQTRDDVWHRNYEADNPEEVRAFYRDFDPTLRDRFKAWKLEREEITELVLEVADEPVIDETTGRKLGYVKRVVGKIGYE